MTKADSTRFLYQMLLNIFLCSQAKKRIYKIAKKKQGKRTLKSYIIFIIFSITIFTLNQVIFFYFQPPNLYEEIEITRRMSVDEIKLHEESLRIKIMTFENMSVEQKIKYIRQVQEIVNILTHPARRLTYDTFGEVDRGSAWAFKNNYFLMSTIIQASIFYIICSFVNMLDDKKGFIKSAFKFQIMAMILLFLWQVDMIMNTQSRFHSTTDMLDHLYQAFPIFERRQMIKTLLIPCMNIIHLFYMYYLESSSERKVVSIGKNVQLRQITKKVSQKVSQIPIDMYFDDKLAVVLKQARAENKQRADIFELQRSCLQNLRISESQNILLDDEILLIFRYFMIK